LYWLWSLPSSHFQPSRVVLKIAWNHGFFCQVTALGKAVSKCANGFSANSLAARTTEAMHLGLLDHVGSRGLILLTSFEELWKGHWKLLLQLVALGYSVGKPTLHHGHFAALFSACSSDSSDSGARFSRTKSWVDMQVV
jgi:hypothetical protein